MTTTTIVDFSDARHQLDPFGAYDALRRDHPVYRDPGTGVWMVLDYDLIREVLVDVATFTNDTGFQQVRSGEIGEKIRKIQAEHDITLAPALLMTDPPVHTWHRRFLDGAFTPRRIRQLETYLHGVINAMIDEFADEPAIDFVSRMAVMVPVHVVADLIGADRSRVNDIKRWSDASAAGVDPSLDEAAILNNVRVSCELQRFILDEARRYRESPADNVLSDVANATVDGRSLTDPELVAMMEQVFVAGHETTTNTMTAAMLRLIENPGLQLALRADKTLIPRFVEEVLRLDSPLQGMWRKATRDVELGGVRIPAGSIVHVRFGAGNRDPKQFAAPADLRLDRGNTRSHLAFGAGIHTCVGNQLARAELRIALDSLLSRLQNFRLASRNGEVARTRHYFIYGIKTLNISFDRISAEG